MINKDKNLCTKCQFSGIIQNVDYEESVECEEKCISTLVMLCLMYQEISPGPKIF